MRRGIRYYRHIAATVLQRYAETETGMIDNEFDARLLDYRMDVERALAGIVNADVVLLSIYRDGLSHDQACAMAGLHGDRPDDWVMRFEVAAGRRFDRAGLSDIEAYLA